MENKTSEMIRTWDLDPYEIDIRFTPRTSLSKVCTPGCAYAFLKEQLNRDDFYIQESVWILVLNRANFIIGCKKVAQGSLSATVIPIKLILTIALQSRCEGFILAHNHPSGSLKPSKPDQNITEKITRASESIEVNFLDHLIITEFGYYSFAQNDLN